MDKNRGFSAKREAFGFTLIELLITISIIAILSAIGLISFKVVLEKGRDAKRQADLKIIQSALEQYRTDQGFYPAVLPSSSPFTNLVGRPTPYPSPKTYLSTVPSDPQGTYPYKYVAIPDSPAACSNGDISAASGSQAFCKSYCLYTKLENLASPAPFPSPCPSPTNYNFVVTPP